MVVAGPFQYDVFLSYTGADWDRANKLYNRLTDHGFTVWMAPKVDPFLTNIPADIEAGLQKSRVVVLCLTPTYLVSGWCTLEWAAAVTRDPANKEGRLIPVVFETCDIPVTLASSIHVEWRGETDAAFAELCTRCRLGTTDESRQTYRTASAAHEKRLRELEAEVAAAFCQHPNVMSALLGHGLVNAHNVPDDETELTRILVHVLSGQNVAKVFNDVHSAWTTAGDPKRDPNVLCRAFWRLLALCKDWRNVAVAIRADLDAGHARAFELQTSTATVAECVMAGADGRVVLLRSDVALKGRGVSAVGLPPTSVFFDTTKQLALDGIVADIASALGLSGLTFKQRCERVEEELIYHETLAPVGEAHPYYFVFDNADFASSDAQGVEARWKALVDGLQKALPTLRLVRLDGTPDNLVGRQVLAIVARSP